ncbi:MAG: pentapeptide repeat-containing protein [Verrucomicrobiota bacterium]
MRDRIDEFVAKSRSGVRRIFIWIRTFTRGDVIAVGALLVVAGVGRKTNIIAGNQEEEMELQRMEMKAQREQIEAQNRQIEIQNALTEADRNTTLRSELINIQNQISSEEPEISDFTKARLSIFTRTVTPYRVLEPSGKLSSRPLSPERADALMVGLNAGISLDSGYIFQHGDFRRLKVNNANLKELSFQDACFFRCNLDESILDKARLERADFTCASLVDSSLVEANIKHADLRGADLRFCDLKNIHNWQTAKWTLANLHGIKNAPDGMLEAAQRQGAISLESSENSFEWQRKVVNWLKDRLPGYETDHEGDGTFPDIIEFLDEEEFQPRPQAEMFDENTKSILKLIEEFRREYKADVVKGPNPESTD